MNTHHTNSGHTSTKSKLARVAFGLGLVASTVTLAAGAVSSASASLGGGTFATNHGDLCFYSATAYDAWITKPVGMPRCDVLSLVHDHDKPVSARIGHLAPAPESSAPLLLEGSATSSPGVDGACFKNPQFWTVSTKDGVLVCASTR